MQNTIKQKFITLIKNTIIFVTVMIGIALLFNFVSPGGIPLITSERIVYIGEEKYAIPVFQTDNQVPAQSNTFVKDVNYQEALKLFHKPGPIFLDARSPEEYNAGHIPGALNIPVSELESFDLDLMAMPANQTFVCYCSDPECDLALRLTLWLEEQGFTNIYYYPAGWQEWTAKGGQVSR